MNEVVQAPKGRNMVTPLGCITVMKMKKYFIIPFLLLTLSAASQIDTAYLPPFAYLTYDTQEWEMKNFENEGFSYVRLQGKIDKGFELKIQLILGDTLITKETLFAKLENRNPYGRKMVMQSFEEMGDYYLGIFNYSQDECSRNDIPLMLKSMTFRAVFRIIDKTNLLTIEIDEDSFFFPEEFQTQKIQNAVNAISVVTPTQLDKLLGLPLSKEKAANLVEETYNKKYKEHFDFNLSKRKCFDDYYFKIELINMIEYSEIDSLLIYASDSTLCDLVAKHQAEMDSSTYAKDLRNKSEIGFNYAERTELLQKARDEAFTLDEYLDLFFWETKEGPIHRLKTYATYNVGYYDRSKYRKIIKKQFQEKYIPENEIFDLDHQKLGDHKHLLKVLSNRNDTIIETMFFHLQKNGNIYDVNAVPLPIELDTIKNKTIIPIWSDEISITSSPKNQLILLYDYKRGSSDFPTHISIGNSKDFKWIPVTPVVLDSTKFLIVKKRPTQEHEGYETDNTSYLWKEFRVNSEKERINAFFKLDYHISIDSAFALNSDPRNALRNENKIENYEIKGFIEQNTYANNIAYQEQRFGDINKDGTEDLYSIIISNGKVVEAKAYLIKENSYEIIGKKEVVKLLKNNTGFKNMILKSQIGNHGKNKIVLTPNLYDLLQE